ncbi:MAG: AAA family ATPase [Mucispirillum sp.]|nr:AAA family ATPase [Mucispirillum sp.]
MRTFTEFFGFYQDPFKRTPDVDFYYPTQMHVDALDTLQYLIHSDEPFAVLTGEPGTGKTITIKKFINELPANIVSAYILFPNLTPEELFMAILEDFNIHVDKSLTKNALFAKLRDFLVEIGSVGQKAVIIIDEAQNLPNETLEELRLLSNLETEKDKLLKIILAGQPELDEKLNEESLRQLKQRVTLYVKLDNIKQEDIKNYIYSHLEKAGKSYVKIHSGVVKRIAKITKGNPRLINTLMERTIIAAFLDNSHTITENHLVSALSSVNNVMATVHKRKGEKAKPFVITAVIACLAVLVGFLGVDKIFNLTDKQPAAQIAANNYTQQPVETTVQAPVQKEQTPAPSIETNAAPAPVQEYADNTISNNDINTSVNTDIYNIPEVAESNSDAVSYNPYSSAVEPQINDIPQVEEQMMIDEPAPVVNKRQDVYILVNSLNIRAIPSLESARVAAAKVGQKYEYVSENEDWVQIRLSPILTGWVFKQYVSISERP